LATDPEVIGPGSRGRPAAQSKHGAAVPPEEAPAPNPSPRLTGPKVANYLAARHGVTVTAEYVRQLTPHRRDPVPAAL
jgi:hypothetical protein